MAAIISAPLAWFPRLANAMPPERASHPSYRAMARASIGRCLDEDNSVQGLLIGKSRV
ncbi:MAG: DUF2442 domain-containing protein [Chromatiales bacterium]|nr:DUF2442 domain-containing protein [Chromatiales bacterium]